MNNKTSPTLVFYCQPVFPSKRRKYTKAVAQRVYTTYLHMKTHLKSHLSVVL